MLNEKEVKPITVSFFIYEVYGVDTFALHIWRSQQMHGSLIFL